MQNTSRHILDIIRKNGQGTAAILSQELDMTKANVRYHLKKLENDGWIKKAGKIEEAYHHLNEAKRLKGMVAP